MGLNVHFPLSWPLSQHVTADRASAEEGTVTNLLSTEITAINSAKVSVSVLLSS